jgi:hypothetical protein
MKFHKTCYPHLSSINSPLNQILLNHHFRTFFHNRRSSILFPETAAHRSGAVWALTPKVREGSRNGGKTDCLKGQPWPKTCTSQAVARQSDPHGKTSPTNGLRERCFKWTEISVNISLQKKPSPKNEEIILVTKFSDTGLGYIVLMYEAQNFQSKSKQHRFGSYDLGLWLHCLSIAKPGSRTFSGDAICVYDVSEVLSTWAAKTSSLTWSNYDRLRPFWQWNNPRPLYGLLHLGVQFQLCADKKTKEFSGTKKTQLLAVKQSHGYTH